MSNILALTFATLVVILVPVFAQDSKPTESGNQNSDREDAQKGDSSIRALKDRAKRGTLHDAFQNVRGDSGKWNDEPTLQHAPPIGQKPAKMPLDDWADQQREKKNLQTASGDDNWLLFRTRQLDDNDRVWVEQIERRGNQFTIVVNEAIWQGRYSKTFTYYNVFGVNLGKLEPGTYEAKWIIKPLTFKQFEGDGRPNENWPKDELPADQKPADLRVSFSVIAKTSSNGQP